MAYLVVIEDVNSVPATPQYCKAVRNLFGLTMPVLMDPDGVLTQVTGVETQLNWWDFLLAQGGILAYKLKWATPAEVEQKLQWILAL